MKLQICDIPASTAINRERIEAAYYKDSYRAPVTKTDASLTDHFFAIFGHHPKFMKWLLILRYHLGALIGLSGASDDEVLNPRKMTSYRAGDRIGRWPILHLSDTELVAGLDDKHLNFRLSLLRERDRQSDYIAVSTICTVNNIFGKIYLFFIVPFHKWGMKKIITNAIVAGRL